MAKASDPRLVDIAKKRPSSAPKPGEIGDIPKIILSERKETPPMFPASLSTSVYSGSFGSAGNNPFDIDRKEGVASIHGYTGSHMPVRSTSDIGLPATSMPNLSVSLMAGGDANISENNLEVFCSPRTFRRSVDFDVNSKDITRGPIEWTDTNEPSSNNLKVLTSSSRVGSALSLNSECTARSIGLLSNDSDSENDLSLTESDKLSTKPAHLKRFMSYPEDSSSSDLCARPSQSMSDIKTVDSTKEETESSSDVMTPVPVLDSKEIKSDQSESIFFGSKPASTNGGRLPDDRSSSPCDPRAQDKIIRTHRKEISRDRPRGGAVRPSHMLSYKCDTHDSARDGRIRQWLQDMDSQN